MIRFVVRFLGLLLLALGFIFLIYDGIRSISDGGVLLTSTSDVWNAVHDRSLSTAQAFIEQHAGADLWQLIATLILAQPAAAVAAVLGILLIVAGRKKKPLIGYVRE